MRKPWDIEKREWLLSFVCGRSSGRLCFYINVCIAFIIVKWMINYIDRMGQLSTQYVTCCSINSHILLLSG
jgi:hypothetical protein